MARRTRCLPLSRRTARYARRGLSPIPTARPMAGFTTSLSLAAVRTQRGAISLSPTLRRPFRRTTSSFAFRPPFLGAGKSKIHPTSISKTDAAAAASPRQTAGVSGEFNRTANEGSGAVTPGTFNLSANDGTISRFGWKAQNKSLLMFAGEAYSVEQGVTNEIFPNVPETESTSRKRPRAALKKFSSAAPRPGSGPPPRLARRAPRGHAARC
jgi:hypothetical protein